MGDANLSVIDSAVVLAHKIFVFFRLAWLNLVFDNLAARVAETAGEQAQSQAG